MGLWLVVFHVCCALAQPLTVVELNCENLFDTQHDSLKQDTDYLPDAIRHWNRQRYWRKLRHLGQTILSCSDEGIPDLVALCEVENDTVIHDLIHRSLLRTAGYDYLMTNSPDLRGIDVALLYSPFSFSPLTTEHLRVTPIKNMRPTRDILYVSGRLRSGDTLHVFVVHAPSRFGGERYSRPFRLCVADRLTTAIDSVAELHSETNILVMGDFNDYADSPALQRICAHGLHNVSANATGEHGVKGTYRYRGKWQSLDHMLMSAGLMSRLVDVRIHSPLFLLEEEPTYGGYRPRRTYNGMRYQPGFSDHLPLVLQVQF